uniref:Putative structural protein n=1 Tax=viral metagenome TaxID=1070528 RepID=A0A6M3KUF2_9ZZZZ
MLNLWQPKAKRLTDAAEQEQEKQWWEQRWGELTGQWFGAKQPLEQLGKVDKMWGAMVTEPMRDKPTNPWQAFTRASLGPIGGLVRNYPGTKGYKEYEDWAASEESKLRVPSGYLSAASGAEMTNPMYFATGAGIAGKVAPQVGKFTGQITPKLAKGLLARQAVKEAPVAEKALVQAVGKGVTPRITQGVAKPAVKEGFAANIRLSKYPEEVQGAIKQWAKVNPEVVQAARRGVRSAEQVASDAKALVEDMGGSFEKLQKGWKPGQAWNAEEVTAIRGYLNETTAKVLETQKLIQGGADTSENQLKLLLQIKEQASVQEMVHGVTAEAGRALAQFRKMANNALESGDINKMTELLKRVKGITGKKGNVEDIVKKLGQLDLNNPVQVNTFLRSLNKPRAMDYLTEIFYNSILSGPKTHIVNAGSNTLTGLLSPIERTVAGLVDIPLSKLQGRAQQRFVGEAAQDIFGLVRGIPEGLRSALYTIKNGISLEQATKWEFRQRAFKGKLGTVVNIPSRVLEGADALGHSINSVAALRAEAYRIGRMEGLKGQKLATRLNEIFNNPTTELLERASKIAEYRLFRQDPGKFTQTMIKTRDAEVFGIAPLKFVIPFLRTPTNLVKFGLERSPLGVLNPKMWMHIAKKDPMAAEEIARTFMGSVTASAITLYAADGKITGAAPRNYAQREKFYAEGKQPYAIKIGNSWVSYQRMEPFNQTLSQVAAVVEAINSDEPFSDEVTQIVESIAKNFASQTYMSSVNDFINAMEDPERYGQQVINKLIASMVVPASAASRTVAQMIDREVKTPTNPWESIQANIPGLSKNVPQMTTSGGQGIVRESPPYLPISITQAKAGGGGGANSVSDYLKGASSSGKKKSVSDYLK